MKNTSFLHVADVHLDSPFASLKRLDEATAERLHFASRSSFEVVIQTAIQRNVAAVVIAGDLFDGPVKDASAGLWVESQFKKLTRAGIQVLLIRGNHDAASNACRVSRWPEGVHEFGSKQASTSIIEQAGIAVHGQSFGARVETEDLAANYPQPIMGCFNLGLLHTSLAGSSTHGTYAPTSMSTLENAGYDYWALGHIHARNETSLSPKCYVGYSGNTQGRHIREPGAKGCQLVELRDNKLDQVEFIATDSLRWHPLDLDISQLEYLRDIEDLLEQQVAPLTDSAEGRALAIRVRVIGSSKLHGELMKLGTVDKLTDALAARLHEMSDIWLESVKVTSSPSMESSRDDVILPLKYLSQVTTELRADPVLRNEMEQVLEELLKKARFELSEYGFPLAIATERDTELTRLIGAAEDMLVARLMGEGQA